MTLFRSLALIPTDENLMITLTTLPTIKIEIWSCKTEIGALVSFSVGCMTTWSWGSHNLVSELDFILIGVCHKDNLYLGTSTIENGNPHPTNIDSWCEPRDHVVTQPIIKIEIWSRKDEIGLIGVWHNGNLPQGTNTIGLSRMTPRSQLIFDKSDSVRSRTKECKNHSHTLKLKNSEVIIIKTAEILAYISLNSSWKINPNGSTTLVGWTDPHTKLTQKP